MSRQNIELGIKIRDTEFNGNQHAQLAWLREFCEVLLDKLDLTEDPEFSEFVEKNKKIKDMLR